MVYCLKSPDAILSWTSYDCVCASLPCFVVSFLQSYGMRASSQQCTEAGDVCAICQSEFRDPLALLCQVRRSRSNVFTRLDHISFFFFLRKENGRWNGNGIVWLKQSLHLQKHLQSFHLHV